MEENSRGTENAVVGNFPVMSVQTSRTDSNLGWGHITVFTDLFLGLPTDLESALKMSSVSYVVLYPSDYLKDTGIFHYLSSNA